MILLPGSLLQARTVEGSSSFKAQLDDPTTILNPRIFQAGGFLGVYSPKREVDATQRTTLFCGLCPRRLVQQDSLQAGIKTFGFPFLQMISPSPVRLGTLLRMVLKRYEEIDAEVVTC